MIVFVQRTSIEGLPPVISLLQVLKDLGEKVVYLGFTQSRNDARILDEIGVEYEFYPYRVVLFRERPIYRLWQKITQFIRPYIFRRWFWRRFKRLVSKEENVILWSCEMESAAIIGDRALELGRRHVVSLYELGDERGKNYYGFDIDRFYKTATLIECEYNRAHILKAEKDIPILPFVLPNKPYRHPRERNLPIQDRCAAAIVQNWKGKRVFLYQGALQNDRGELFVLIESLCRLFPDVIVAVMGLETEAVKKCRQKYANFSYVPHVTPPSHLEVTSHADVGIAFYQGGSVHGLSPLNPVYCAPNKVFEYSGFGMPILCNDIPGLRYSIGYKESGICLGEFKDDDISDAVGKLIKDYESYSLNASRLFESVDVVAIINNILEYVRR